MFTNIRISKFRTKHLLTTKQLKFGTKIKRKIKYFGLNKLDNHSANLMGYRHCNCLISNFNDRRTFI